jgi:hypothetical protein
LDSTDAPGSTIGQRIKLFLIARFGKVAAAADAFGIRAASLYPYFRGEKEPGAPLLRRLATFGANTHWIITGKGNMFAEGSRTADLDVPEPAVSQAEVGGNNPVTKGGDERMLILDAMGIDSAEKLRRFFDPEAFVADMLATYVAHMRPKTGK